MQLRTQGSQVLVAPLLQKSAGEGNARRNNVYIYGPMVTHSRASVIQGIRDRPHSHGNVHVASIWLLTDAGRSLGLWLTALITIGCAACLEVGTRLEWMILFSCSPQRWGRCRAASMLHRGRDSAGGIDFGGAQAMSFFSRGNSVEDAGPAGVGCTAAPEERG